MLQFGKYLVVAFFVIVKSFDEHFFLRWKPVLFCRPDLFVDFLKTVFAETVKGCAGKELTGLWGQCNRAALTVKDIAHFAGEDLATFGAVFFFVFLHVGSAVARMPFRENETGNLMFRKLPVTKKGIIRPVAG